MPCRSYDEYDIAAERLEEAKLHRELTDKLARIACNALQALEDIATGNEIATTCHRVLADKEVLSWWPAHKAADAAEQNRVALEKKRKAEAKRKKAAALAKLTPEDRKILGVK